MTSTANSGSKERSRCLPSGLARANPASRSNRKDAADVVSNSRPASIDHTNHTFRRAWPINCQLCSSSNAQIGLVTTKGPNSSADEPNAVTVMVKSTASTACCPPTTERASR